MSVRVWSLCWKVPLPGIPKLVLLRLADFANETGGSIYPAVSTVADDCGISSRTVQNALRTLEDTGVLVAIKSSKGGRGCTTSYRIDMARAIEMAGPAKMEEQFVNAGTGNYESPSQSFDIGMPADAAPRNYEPASKNYAGDSRNYESPSRNYEGRSYDPSLTVKNPPSPAARETTTLISVGGGGSDIHQVIEEFYRIAGCIWGNDTVTRERITTTKNDHWAAEWIRLAGGSVDLVIQKISPALTSYSQGRGCPGTLGAISRSMPGMITNALSSVPSQSASKPFAGPSASAGDDTWVKIKSLAFRNGHLDVAEEIRRRAVEISDDEANRFAEDMRSLVSTKKAQAAA